MAAGDGGAVLCFLSWDISILWVAADLPLTFCYSDFWNPVGIKSLTHEQYIPQTSKLHFLKMRVPKGRAAQQTPSSLDSYLSFQQSVSVAAPLFPQGPEGGSWKATPSTCHWQPCHTVKGLHSAWAEGELETGSCMKTYCVWKSWGCKSFNTSRSRAIGN